jgi:hypothetical protein
MIWTLFAFLGLFTADASTSKWSYVEAYAVKDGGDWYIGNNNESAYLAWGESYVMMSLAAMYRASQGPEWLDELARHADAALAQRDDVRGVSDYRGVSAACWQNTSYQPSNQPYCYVVHSGMIAYPIAEFARLVGLAGLEEEVAYDGITFGEKATTYTDAAKEVVAAHDDQWRGDGYYVFRPDASFLGYPGQDLPLNQSNAMGRLLLVLYDLTGDVQYRDKAQALASRFKTQMTGYLWNYWGGTYSGNGEDISHAAINVDFATMIAERGLGFTDADMIGLSDTFMNVYLDDGTFSDFIGGGPTNGSSYRPQIARWLRLTPWRTSVYTAVRDLMDNAYSPPSASGSHIMGWSLLAEFEPKHCAHFFYHVDWDDPNPETEGDLRAATAYGANILTRPHDLAQGCMIPLDVEMGQQVTVAQWDGAAYHRVATWAPVSGRRYVPYEPRWPHVYWDGGVLYQFEDPKYTGEAVSVWESTGLVAPTITSTPPVSGVDGDPIEYTVTGEGDAPFWWSLSAFPTGARIDPGTGTITWAPSASGEYTFTVVLDNDVGRTEQSFTYLVEAVDTGTPDTGDSDTDTDTEDTGSQETGEPDNGDPAPRSEISCGCRNGGGAWLVLFLPVLWRYRVRHGTTQ